MKTEQIIVVVSLFTIVVHPDYGSGSEVISNNPEDVQFFLYTNMETTHELILNNLSSFDLVKPDVKTFLVIDGFLSNFTMPMTKSTKNMLLRQSPGSNVIAVDWRKLNGNGITLSGYQELFHTYKKVVLRVDTVGKRVAAMLHVLHKQKNVPYSRFHIVGHSLGAHISGSAGKWSKKEHNQTIDTITALDPAGPTFSRQNDTDKRLYKGDAVFIEMYHTNRAVLGDTAVGTANINIFVNNGYSQPGCEEADPNMKASSELYKWMANKQCKYMFTCRNFFRLTPITGIICSHSYSWRLWNKCSENECTACQCIPIKACLCSTTCPSCAHGIQVGLHIDRRVNGSANIKMGPIEEPADEKMFTLQFNKF